MFNQNLLASKFQGQNQLLFTYGATSSGKTFTIQGTKDDPGIVPRALDVLFNTVGERLVGSESSDPEGGHANLFRPFAFQGVAAMKPEDATKLEQDKKKIVALGCELIEAAQRASSNHLRPSGSNLLPHSSNDDSFFSTSTASQQTIMSHGNISLQSLATMFPQVFCKIPGPVENK